MTVAAKRGICERLIAKDPAKNTPVTNNKSLEYNDSRGKTQDSYPRARNTFPAVSSEVELFIPSKQNDFGKVLFSPLSLLLSKDFFHPKLFFFLLPLGGVSYRKKRMRSRVQMELH